MRTWDKESAIKELEHLIDRTEALASERRGSAEHVRWRQNVLDFLGSVFGENSAYYMQIASLDFQASGSFFASPHNFQKALKRRQREAYLKQLEAAKGVLQAAHDRLIQADSLDEIYQGKDTSPEASGIIKIINLAENKLRKTIREEPDSEQAVQDAFENLLIATGINYEREGPTIEYSSKKYRPDFTIEKLDLAIELKLCTRSGREKELIKEINDDIQAYKTKYGNMLYVVYDLGNIRDIDQFKEALEGEDGVVMRVIKH